MISSSNHSWPLFPFFFLVQSRKAPKGQQKGSRYRIIVSTFLSSLKSTVACHSVLLPLWPFVLNKVEFVMWGWKETILKSFVKMTHRISKQVLWLKNYIDLRSAIKFQPNSVYSKVYDNSCDRHNNVVIKNLDSQVRQTWG